MALLWKGHWSQLEGVQLARAPLVGQLAHARRQRLHARRVGLGFGETKSGASAARKAQPGEALRGERENVQRQGRGLVTRK